jgi:hypothetical protein
MATPDVINAKLRLMYVLRLLLLRLADDGWARSYQSVTGPVVARPAVASRAFVS